ncbi:hypothetical protein Poli38472_010013 [Pythium oligandrum]|uniref:Uncharacterized protein n=1 Tax=Pythium oligandrum TaxID=41045 RepID=A0A8K1FEY9_PYTOL|nr:hypothetical protein Poli38472_010013 [Pythium oligandrum]|eukprot:TMW58454.1 hypothetical protein Poli38472_010013 [Pythium oligandrum]
MSSVGRRLAVIWKRLQVESNGYYSITRLQSLQDYCKHTPWWKVLAYLLITPVPSVLLVILIDTVPMADPDAGPYHNYMFWCRGCITIFFISISVLEQFRYCIPQLPIGRRSVLVISVTSTTAAIGFQFGSALVIGFPLPFGFVFTAIAWTPTLFAQLIYVSRHLLREDQAFRRDFKGYIMVLCGQLALSVVYPLYVYIFKTLDGPSQFAFFLLLPVIKIAAKNWLGHFLPGNDVKPEVIIFNIEVFHALYVACALQNVNSTSAMASIMAIDLIMVWVAVAEINELYVHLSMLVKKAANGSKAAESTSFLRLCVDILEDPIVRNHPRLANARTASLQAISRTQIRSMKTAPGSSILKASPRKNNANPSTQDVLCLHERMNVDEKLHFVAHMSQMLFMAEFVVLIEFAEVVVPVIYSIFILMMVKLPNRKFYPLLVSDLDAQHVTANIVNVLIYSVLEFASFLLITALLTCKLHFSIFHQLAFVLDRQWTVVQAKFVIWTFFVIQSYLTHFETLDTSKRVDDKLLFVAKLSKVLLTTEFTILVEFNEVVVPVMYSTFLSAMSQLPNRAYYSQLAPRQSQLLPPVMTFFLYSALEFLSFVSITMLLKRKLRLSTLHQLAFVLETQWVLVQSKLIRWTFFVIESSIFHFVGCAFISLTVLEQFRGCLPRLGLNTRIIAFVSFTLASLTTFFQMGCASLIGFPLPFTFFFAAMIWTPAIILQIVFVSRLALQQDATLRTDFCKYLVVFFCQISLTVVYPAYLSVFVGLKGTTQTAFFLLLPVIKILNKNWISRFLPNNDGVKPEVIIFNIEIFHALYISCALQNVSSTGAMVVIMAIDLVLIWLAISDINALLAEINQLVKRLQGHDTSNGSSLDTTNLLRLCREFLDDPVVTSDPRFHSKHSSILEQMGTKQWLPSLRATVQPQELTAQHSSLTAVGPCSDDVKVPLRTRTEYKIDYISKTAQMLFTTEFVILIEFTEVIVPTMYSIFLTAMSQLTNRAYYPQLAPHDQQHLVAIASRVFLYSALESLSFAFITILLKRKLSLSALHQLAFVLETQWVLVQSKLILWTFFVIESSIFHFGQPRFPTLWSRTWALMRAMLLAGTDFSFKFAWLHAK